jgi:hypothetical protein
VVWLDWQLGMEHTGCMMIARIVSGGQTGVDQGALQACQWIDFPYGGWVPKGRLTEAEPLPLVYKGMQEHSSADYLARTEANVVDSDATLVLCHGRPQGGTLRTIKFAQKHNRPWHHMNLMKPMDTEVEACVEWLKGCCPDNCVLNVAGTRESKEPGIQKAALVWVLQILGKANGKCYYPPPMEKSIR